MDRHEAEKQEATLRRPTGSRNSGAQRFSPKMQNLSLGRRRSYFRFVFFFGIVGYLFYAFVALPNNWTASSILKASSGSTSLTAFEQFQQQTHYGCDRCLVNPGICSTYGTTNVDLARGYDGSGKRWQKVLEKAKSGRPIKSAVLGGSVSRGHGIPEDGTRFWEGYANWLNATFPHPEHSIIDGSVGARGSNYFKFCHGEHIDNDVDVVILEFAVNDFRMGDASFDDFETLIRSILEYPSEPAIMMFQWLKLDGILATGGDSHLSLAHYYDIPVISLRNVIVPLVIDDKDKIKEVFVWTTYDWQFKVQPDKFDVLHPNQVGHSMGTDMMVLYLEQQLCFMDHRPIIPPSLASFVTPEDKQVVNKVPRLRLNQQYDYDTIVPQTNPLCLSIDSLENPLSPVLDQTQGYELYQQSEEKKFWRGEHAGDKITFEVTTSAPEGEITLYFLRSAKFHMGEAKCWVDDDLGGAVTVEGWWTQGANVGDYRSLKSQGIKPGKHLVHCVNSPHEHWWPEGKGETMMIIGLFAV